MNNKESDSFDLTTSVEACHAMKTTDIDEQKKAEKAERLLETYRNWGRFDESHHLAFAVRCNARKDRQSEKQ